MDSYTSWLGLCRDGNRNHRSFSWVVVRMLAVSFFLLAIIACTHNVPLSETLSFQNLPQEKIDKTVLVVMHPDFETKKVIAKPMALSDSFEFAIGKSVKSNLMFIMTSAFNDVQFANKVPPKMENVDYVLIAKFVEFNPVLGRTIFSDHQFYIKIDYLWLDANKEKLFTVNSVSGGEEEMSGQERTLILFSPALGQQGWSNSMARGCDKALASSLNQFFIKLDDYLKQENLIQSHILYHLLSLR